MVSKCDGTSDGARSPDVRSPDGTQRLRKGRARLRASNCTRVCGNGSGARDVVAMTTSRLNNGNEMKLAE